MGSQGPVDEPLSVWAIALREQAKPFSAEQFARLKEAVAKLCPRTAALAAPYAIKSST